MWPDTQRQAFTNLESIAASNHSVTAQAIDPWILELTKHLAALPPQTPEALKALIDVSSGVRLAQLGVNGLGYLASSL